jgi:hypothetical protein
VKISELLKQLYSVQAERGDLDVFVWPIRYEDGGAEITELMDEPSLVLSLHPDGGTATVLRIEP